MSRRRSPLGRLVWLRQITERSARGDLGRAQNAEAQAREHLARIREAGARAIRIDEILTPIELGAMRLQGIRMKELEAAAESAHEIAESRLEQRIGAWRTAVAERDSAERLHDRRRVAAALTAAKAAERTLDDLQITRRRRHDR